MQLLFLTPQLPFPPTQGTSLRNYHIIAGLSQRHEIDLLSFIAPEQSLHAATHLHKLCRTITSVPQPVRSPLRRMLDTVRQPLPDMALRMFHPAMAQKVQEAVRTTAYDIIQIEGIEMAPYLFLAADAIAMSAEPPLIVFDDHNCEYLLQKRNAFTDLKQPRRVPAALYSLIQWQKLVRYERLVCQSANQVVAVSQPDARALRQLGGAQAITVVPNGVDVSFYNCIHQQQRAHMSAHRLVFIGKMDYRPNVDAVLWFAHHVLPLLSKRGCDFVFDIVGMNPHRRLDELRANPQVEIVGGVEDVRPYLRRASLYAIPMRVGGGTRFKALEAMAARIPIVSTTLGVEGIGVQHEQHLLLGDTPAEFAAHIQRLLSDLDNNSGLCPKLVETSFEYVNNHYSWSTILPLLEGLYQRP